MSVELATTSWSARAMMAYAKPILSGLLILAAGVLPWMIVSDLNARIRPDIPWAALASLAWIAVLLAWLHGRGVPRRTSDERRRRLRLWPPAASPGADSTLTVQTTVLLLVLLYGAWIVIGRMSPVPDLAAYPTTSYRWSMFLLGGFMSGVIEEAAYRGYMQTGLERIDPARAVLITSVVFALSHITHGVGTLLLLGPGLLIAGLLYGSLAARTGTILPGIVIHVLGDLSYTFFGVLRGDPSLLFVP